MVFQEFSNEERCNMAKSKLEDSLKEAGAKLRSGLEDLKSLGKADPAQIIIAFSVDRVPNNGHAQGPRSHRIGGAASGPQSP